MMIPLTTTKFFEAPNAKKNPEEQQERISQRFLLQSSLVFCEWFSSLSTFRESKFNKTSNKDAEVGDLKGREGKGEERENWKCTITLRAGRK